VDSRGPPSSPPLNGFFVLSKFSDFNEPVQLREIPNIPPTDNVVGSRITRLPTERRTLADVRDSGTVIVSRSGTPMRKPGLRQRVSVRFWSEIHSRANRQLDKQIGFWISDAFNPTIRTHGTFRIQRWAVSIVDSLELGAQSVRQQDCCLKREWN
jgi:hypothetical protein